MDEEKIEINPMHKGCAQKYKFMLSPRCGAKTRQQTSCLSPAVHGKNRCRMHGGAKGSGAPKGNQNAIKNGYYTRDAKIRRQEVSALIRYCRMFIDEIDMDSLLDEPSIVP